MPVHADRKPTVAGRFLEGVQRARERINRFAGIKVAGACSGCSGKDCSKCHGSRTDELSTDRDKPAVSLWASALQDAKAGQEKAEERQAAHFQPAVHLKAGEAPPEHWKPQQEMLREDRRRAADALWAERTERQARLRDAAWESAWIRDFGLSFMAEEQRKKERARLKELGNRMSAEERKRLVALEEEILRKQMQLEALKIKNLENALSALDCSSAS